MTTAAAKHTAIVTGGAQGIGRASALRLAADGVQVVVADVQESGVDVVAEIEAAGGVASYAFVDTSDPQSVETLVRSAGEKFGTVDTLVAAAGIIGRAHLPADLPLEEYQRVIAVNLTGVVLSCQAVLPGMLEKGWGRIVVLSSNARNGVADRPHYAISKAGVVGYVASLAHAYARQGVLANCIDPGLVLTDMVTSRYDQEVLANPSGISIGRPARPEETAEMIAYLCSERNTYTVGSVVDVTGGLQIG